MLCIIILSFYYCCERNVFLDAIGNKKINESIDFPIRFFFFFNLSEGFAFFSRECTIPWSGFLSCGTIGIWGQIILCPVLCRVFNNISGFYPLDASNTSSFWFVTNANDSRHCQISLWGAKSPPVRILRTVAFLKEPQSCLFLQFVGGREA